MTPPEAPLPTFKDICPDDVPTLDAQSAARNFLGKTVADAEAMFRENLIHYTEDLWAMGTAAFEYYLPAVWNYITSEASRDDHTVDGLVNVVFECRHREGTLGNSTPLVLQCLDYLIAHFDKFDVSELPDLNMKDFTAGLHQDDDVRQRVEKEWIGSGGAAEVFPDLWKTLENPPDSLNLKSDLPGSTFFDRWKALKESIAKGQAR